MNWHGTIVILEWLLLTAGVLVLKSKTGWSLGVVLMAASLLFQAIGGCVSFVAIEAIDQRLAYWILMLAWTISTLVFAGGFLLVCLEKRAPIQTLQRNAGSRPSSGDSPASETPSSGGPRG